jgi:hypothetical protein
MLTEYFRRQADICLRLSLVTSSEEGRYQMIAKAWEYTAKADAIKAREAESKSSLTAIVAQGA